MDSDTYAERALYETREPNPARLELLDFLAEQGVTIDEMVAADAEGRLTGILTDRLTGPRCLTLTEVAARAQHPST